jgi:hypothetical protein
MDRSVQHVPPREYWRRPNRWFGDLTDEERVGAAFSKVTQETLATGPVFIAELLEHAHPPEDDTARASMERSAKDDFFQNISDLALHNWKEIPGSGWMGELTVMS